MPELEGFVENSLTEELPSGSSALNRMEGAGGSRPQTHQVEVAWSSRSGMGTRSQIRSTGSKLSDAGLGSIANLHTMEREWGDNLGKVAETKRNSQLCKNKTGK